MTNQRGATKSKATDMGSALRTVPGLPEGGDARARPSDQWVLEARNVSHSFGDFAALDDVSVQARAGEFVTLLGPSGSGKTTLLRIIVGLERATSVEALEIGGQDMRNVPANHRNIAMVFQHYGLFPHMSVGENVEYGLKVRRIAREQRRERAAELLELVRLSGLYDRRVHQLSGGERQRVALARALAPHPTIVLLDEPLGALDEKLRNEMQVELKELQQSLHVTFVYVTHSQEEALTMSDRIFLLNGGRVVQEGPPRALFERPANRFVADFMGFENIVSGVLNRCDGTEAVARLDGVLVSGRWSGERAPQAGFPVIAAVRAEKIQLCEPQSSVQSGTNRISCRIGASTYKGKYWELAAETDIGRMRVRAGQLPQTDNLTDLSWPAEDCVIAPID